MVYQSERQVLLSRQAVQYVHRHACAVGGITTFKKICSLAEVHDLLVIPHNPLGPASTTVCLKICASVPNLGIQELPGFCLNGAEDRHRCPSKNGCMLVPDAPGIGIELADNAEELHPSQKRGGAAAKRAFDGSIKDWQTVSHSAGSDSVNFHP